MILVSWYEGVQNAQLIDWLLEGNKDMTGVSFKAPLYSMRNQIDRCLQPLFIFPPTILISLWDEGQKLNVLVHRI